jgi:hypothetical protein
MTQGLGRMYDDMPAMLALTHEIRQRFDTEIFHEWRELCDAARLIWGFYVIANIWIVLTILGPLATPLSGHHARKWWLKG